MTPQLRTEIDGAVLLAEIERYLAAVETFRAEGREPTWLAEAAPCASAPPRRRRTKAWIS